MEEIKEYTREDFLDSNEPYEWLYNTCKGNDFKLQKLMIKMCDVARKVGIKNFKTMFASYVQSVRQQKQDTVYVDNATNFTDQELELNAGQWQADDLGVSIDTVMGEVMACPHPIMPVLRLVNIDTNVEKLKLAYRKGRQWRYVIADKKTLASNNAIISLADVGIAVNSENSKYLVRYLSDLENINYDIIPEKSSVSRLGWIDGAGFSPYVEDLVFDGEESFKSFFKSVHEQGSFNDWLSAVLEIRRGAVPARVILAASFASVLVKKVEALSFFVHLWGSESGTGKTVALMLAASVWADPEMGKYIHTFNGTAVSQELSAGFVNSMPLILDEFQVIKDKKTFEQSVYMLAEGVGKGRGAKQGGVQRLQTWKNCILTSGEMPITNFMTGAGAFNRIVEIECTEKLFQEPQKLLSVLRSNYGHAGKIFVNCLQLEESRALALELYQKHYNEIVKSQTTEKQAMAGALLLTADELATRWIFKDGRPLDFEDIKEFLQTKSEVDINERAYSYICETIAANTAKFNPQIEIGEVWGKLDSGTNRVYIIRNIFERICTDGGYSSRATLSWLARQGLIETSINKQSGKVAPTVVKKLGGSSVRCVSMQLCAYEDEILELIEDL